MGNADRHIKVRTDFKTLLDKVRKLALTATDADHQDQLADMEFDIERHILDLDRDIADIENGVAA